MNAVVQVETPRMPSLVSGGAVRAIVPQDFDGAWRIANAVVKAGMAPKGLDTPEKSMVAILHGMEVGMTPMASLQSIAVVNGRPTIWGDGAIGLVRGSGKCEWIKERIDGEGDNMVAICEVKRKGEEAPIRAVFSVADAKKAGLWGKQGPWQQYPKRMLTMRARAFALRDAFADVLRGLGIAEEVQDIHAGDAAPIPPSAPRPPSPPSAQIAAPVGDAETVQNDPEDSDSSDIKDGEPFDAADFFEEMETQLAGAMDAETVEEVWTVLDPEGTFDGDDVNLEIAHKIKARRLAQLHPLNAG